MNYLLIALLHLVNPSSIDNTEALSHDIILIQGEAKLVTMTPTGDIVQSYNISEDYFSSTDSHEDIVNRAVAKTSELINTRFIRVKYDAEGLSESAVEHIRYISVLAEQDEDAMIYITLAKDDDTLMVADKLTSMIEGFGIDKSRIKIVPKTYLGQGESQFIKVTLAS